MRNQAAGKAMDDLKEWLQAGTMKRDEGSLLFPQNLTRELVFNAELWSIICCKSILFCSLVGWELGRVAIFDATNSTKVSSRNGQARFFIQVL